MEIPFKVSEWRKFAFSRTLLASLKKSWGENDRANYFYFWGYLHTLELVSTDLFKVNTTDRQKFLPQNDCTCLCCAFNLYAIIERKTKQPFTFDRDMIAVNLSGACKSKRTATTHPTTTICKSYVQQHQRRRAQRRHNSFYRRCTNERIQTRRRNRPVVKVLV